MRMRNQGLMTLLAGMMMIGGGGMIGGATMGKRDPEPDPLPTGFEYWYFVRETGELIDDAWSKEKINELDKMDIFQIMSKTEENARKEFERLTKKGKR